MSNPSNFKTYPWSSVCGSSEHETIALNIITILKRTGDNWRKMNWDEYKAERLKDGHFTESEKKYFDDVVKYTTSAESARLFSNTWANL